MPAEENLFLDQKQLARRWGLSERTLEKWRWAGRGPQYVTLNWSVVRYPLAEIERYEAEHRRPVGGGQSR